MILYMHPTQQYWVIVKPVLRAKMHSPILKFFCLLDFSKFTFRTCVHNMNFLFIFLQAGPLWSLWSYHRLCSVLGTPRKRTRIRYRAHWGLSWMTLPLFHFNKTNMVILVIPHPNDMHDIMSLCLKYCAKYLFDLR